MKLIHSSDWHLGQTLKGHDRRAEQQVFLGWLLDTLVEREADALLVAGDIFDQANPSPEAQAQYYQFIARAKKVLPNLSVVVIAGNHDSPLRLDAPHPVLDAFGVHVVGRHDARAPLDERLLERLAVPLMDRNGRIGAWVLAVPFLRPGDLVRVEGGSYEDAVRDAYARLADALEPCRGSDAALIVMGHLHAQDGVVSGDSERRLIVGDEEALSSSVFPQCATYVALGHLHKPQAIGAEHIRYSGSPLPLSFTEMDYKHQVLEVRFDGAHLAGIEALRTPRPVKLLRVPERFAPLDEVLQALKALEIDAAQQDLQPLLEVQLLASLPPTDLRAQVEAALADKPVRLAGITRKRPELAARSAETAGESATRFDLSGLKPQALFERLLGEHTDIEIPEEVRGAFHELLDAVHQEGRA
ncbi:MAG: exonuclease SbcCD subunit D C-terminal domain-containing protein [Betaproteobacteria bacterium]|nr:exonuclease SbcCD subunit D C-terminal domain-containing protein [Betaproteobacteria bacterium]